MVLPCGGNNNRSTTRLPIMIITVRVGVKGHNYNQEMQQKLPLGHWPAAIILVRAFSVKSQTIRHTHTNHNTPNNMIITKIKYYYSYPKVIAKIHSHVDCRRYRPWSFQNATSKKKKKIEKNLQKNFGFECACELKLINQNLATDFWKSYCETSVCQPTAFVVVVVAV